MADCIFCKIAQKEIPSQLVYEDEQVAAFRDLEPQAPVHVLVIPKKHVESLLALTAVDKDLISHIMIDVIPQLAKELQVDEKGFRVVANTGDEGGQRQLQSIQSPGRCGCLDHQCRGVRRHQHGVVQRVDCLSSIRQTHVRRQRQADLCLGYTVWVTGVGNVSIEWCQCKVVDRMIHCPRSGVTTSEVSVQRIGQTGQRQVDHIRQADLCFGHLVWVVACVDVTLAGTSGSSFKNPG